MVGLAVIEGTWSKEGDSGGINGNSLPGGESLHQVRGLKANFRLISTSALRQVE
jgi:hypothetical protein